MCIVPGILLTLAACSKDDPASRLPLRSECIVGARLTWPEGTSDTNAQAIVARLTREMTRNQQAGVAGVQNQGNDAIYVIYAEDCPSRDGKFDYLLRQLQLAVYQAPGFDVIEDEIEPGPATIDVYGPQWRDGQRPEE